jgi:putative membrane-bound dehydrogenase-like protein
MVAAQEKAEPAKQFIGAPDPGTNSQASPLLPAEEQRTFTLPPDFQIELLASESDGIGKFVTVDWDIHGRMWSMTALEYPLDANENPEAAKRLYASKAKDKILVWDDPYLPGPLAKPRVFADGLAIPLGILPYKNGVYVQHGPDIVFLSDNDGDGKADRRQVILSGFGVQDSHLFPHQFTRAPGGWIWMAQGAFNYGKVRTTKGEEQQFDRTRMARFRYDGSEFEITSQGPCNIWGLVLTAEGEAWIQEANDYGYPAMPFHLYANYPGCSDSEWKSYAPEFPGTAPDFAMGGTGLSGLALSDKAAWPQPYGDVLYVANPITRKVQALKINRDGIRYKLEKLPDFIQSSDTMFRPVSIHFGPDGCLYIVDWYNKIISHNEVPRNHPERDKTRGRIWRVSHKQQRPFQVPDLEKMAGRDLLLKLGGESLTQNHLAWQTIIDRRLDELRPALQEIIGDPSQSAARRVAALWALEGLDVAEVKLDQGALYLRLLGPLTRDQNRSIRREAIRVLGACQFPIADPDNRWTDVFDLLESHAADPDSEVRAEVVKTTAGLLSVLERVSEQKSRQLISQRVLPLLLGMAKPPLAEPTAKSTHSGRVIKVGEAYEREFERYLVRFFLEQHSRSLSEFLDSGAADSLPLSAESRSLACLALGGREGAVRLARSVERRNRALSDDELVLLGGFSSEGDVSACLSRYLLDPKTQKEGLRSLLNIHSRLQNPELPGLIAPIAQALLSREPSDENRDLFLRLAATFRLSSLEPKVLELASAQEQPPERRALAVKALGEMGANQLDLFQRLALASTNASVQQEALLALVGAKNDRAMPLLIEIWPVLSANSRKAAIDRLTRSQQNTQVFVRAVKKGDLSSDQLDTHAYEKIKGTLGDDPELAALGKAAASSSLAQSTEAENKIKLDRVRELAMKPGDSAKGRGLFVTMCLVCHTVHGEGRNLGPVLNGAGAMDPESLLRSIVNPGAAVESGYYRYRVETNDGESLEGLFLSQSETEIRLRPVTGEDVRIPRSAVKRAGFSKFSLMPDGLLDAMSPQEVADLFAYLRTLK